MCVFGSLRYAHDVRCVDSVAVLVLCNSCIQYVVCAMVFECIVSSSYVPSRVWCVYCVCCVACFCVVCVLHCAPV